MNRINRNKCLVTVTLIAILTLSAMLQTNIISINPVESQATQASSIADPEKDLVYIYTGQPIPPEKYVDYVDVTDVTVEKKTDELWCMITIVKAPPVNLENTIFYTFMFDENNNSSDNSMNYPMNDVDTMYTVVYTKTGGWRIERAKYQVIGDWWMNQTTNARFGLASSLPGGFSISMQIPLTELHGLTYVMPWRVETDTFNSTLPDMGDFAPDEGLAYLGSLTCHVHTDKFSYYIGETVTIFYSVSQACDWGIGIAIYGPNGTELLADLSPMSPGVEYNFTVETRYPTGRRDVFFQAGKISGPNANATCEFYVAATPEPYIAHPPDGSLISGNVTDVSALEMNFAPNIVKCAFEYSQTNTGPWTLIELDTNSTNGWATYWNLTSLIEGDYWIRATMINDISQFGEDIAHVYFDPLPPIPTLTVPTFPVIIPGTIYLQATTPSIKAKRTDWWVSHDPWKVCIGYMKNVTKLSQNEIDAEKANCKPELACSPTAAASCLAYWQNLTDKDRNQPYKDLYDGTPEGLKKMARELCRYCKTDGGTYQTDLRNGIRDYVKGLQENKKLNNVEIETKWIEQKGVHREGEPGKPDKETETIVKDMILEFLACNDVIFSDGAHTRTMSSIHFEGLKEDKYIPGQIPPSAKILVDYMDPAKGDFAWSEVDLKENTIGGVKIDDAIIVKLSQKGGGGKMESVVDMEKNTIGRAEVSEMGNLGSPEWTLIGEDTNGIDGWSVPWNTSQLPDGFYLVKATMTDTMSHSGSDLMLVYVNNARATRINSTKTVVSGNYTAVVQVSVENLYAGPASFNITLNCNETLIGTASVTLASQTSTELKFTWNTTDVPKGNYTISVNTSVLLSSTYLSRMTYTGGWIVITIPGDIDGDFAVKLADLVLLAKAYGSKPGDSNWNPNADIDGNFVVGLSDLVKLAIHYGQHYP